MSELNLLLDEGRLSGVRGVQRQVGPDRVATIVDCADIEDARTAIEELCFLWGGSVGALIPHPRDQAVLDARWERYLCEGVFDRLATRGVLAEGGERRRPGVFVTEHVDGEPLLTFLWSRGREIQDWAPIECALPEPASPWYFSYLAALGSWPERPLPDQLRRAGFVEDFEFEQLVPVKRGTVEEPGALDLVQRLRRSDRDYPARICTDSLALYSAPVASHMSDQPPLPVSGWERSRYGANLVVVYEPGAVEDLALLWNLRAAHGLHPSLPLAVPVTANVVEALRTWSSQGEGWALRLWGLVTGRPWGLLSLSVSPTRLEEFAEAAGPNWALADPDVVLHPGERAMRPSSDVATFVEGTAQISALSPADRDLLRVRPPEMRRYDLRVRSNPDDRLLPPTQTFKRFLPTLEGYQGGGAERAVHRVDDIATVDWPSGWATLEAVIRDRGIAIQPSRSGRAAVALLQRLGSFDELHPLLSSSVLRELVRLGTRSGSAWFEQKVRELQEDLAAVDEGAAGKSAEIERQLAELRLRPFEADRAELTYSALNNVLGAPAAREWLGWAESRELLLRGAEVECDRCRHRSWRPAAELAPPVVCIGCGQRITRPFRPDVLQFRYRASELLLQVLQLNVLPHLLALRWLCALLESHGLYGGHPGLEFLDERGEVIGEADVALLFVDGRLALGECKLTPRGLNQAEVDRHEALADRLDGSWTFYSTPQWLEECEAPWIQLPRELPDRPRFAITAEQLFVPRGEIFWAAGDNPLRPQAADDGARAERHSTFVDSLPDFIGGLDRRSHLDRILLDEE